MPDQDNGPYSLSHVLHEELKALRGGREPTLNNLAEEFDRLGAANEQEPERRKAVYQTAHQFRARLSALCLSGGGIRSGACADSSAASISNASSSNDGIV